jgi:hypothetical protein
MVVVVEVGSTKPSGRQLLLQGGELRRLLLLLLLLLCGLGLRRQLLGSKLLLEGRQSLLLHAGKTTRALGQHLVGAVTALGLSLSLCLGNSCGHQQGCGFAVRALAGGLADAAAPAAATAGMVGVVLLLGLLLLLLRVVVVVQGRAQVVVAVAPLLLLRHQG